MFYLNSVQNYKLCVVELLQAREEIIGHSRNINCLSSCVNQVWKRALSIPCSKLECQVLWSNLVCWQFCDRKVIWPAQFFCFKIGVIIAPHLMVLLSGSTLDHEYEEVYRTAIWWNQGRCSLGLMWGGGWGGRLHWSDHICCYTDRDSSGQQLCCPVSNSVCSSHHGGRPLLLCVSCSLRYLRWGVRPESWRWRRGRWWKFWALSHF